MRRIIIALTGLLILAGVAVSISNKEMLLVTGRVVLLELAPVDPRSLMQGDYMALRFKAANEAFGIRPDQASLPTDGRIVLSVNEDGVATFKRLDIGAPLAAGEVAMRYRIRDHKPKFATNAFFFQEGHAQDYAKARYGEFRVADSGECILTGLRDENLVLLGSQNARQ
ncbi:MAG: GDYXXLXY domain-containing protein [Nitrospirota bacterium]|nr:GDYXXLXY domain-containing protein [Nitrospirota bacterium]